LASDSIPEKEPSGFYRRTSYQLVPHRPAIFSSGCSEMPATPKLSRNWLAESVRSCVHWASCRNPEVVRSRHHGISNEESDWGRLPLISSKPVSGQLLVGRPLARNRRIPVSVAHLDERREPDCLVLFYIRGRAMPGPFSPQVLFGPDQFI
jgi:hypothetical protein